MAKQTINIGTSANDGTGSTLREAFDITNDNFTELYGGTGGLFHKIEGTNFTGSLLIGHSTTGTLSAAIKNTGVGLLALDALTSGDSNTAIGYNAGSSINSGGDNVLIGSQAGDALTTGSSNVAIGKNALSAEDGHGTNTAVGYETLKNLNAGANAHNTAIGYDAGTSLTTGIRNTLVGSRAGDALTEGPRNVAIGYLALSTEDTGRKNTAVGHEALKDLNYDGDGNNVAIGNVAGTAITTGIQNTVIGGLAGDALTEGSNNIIIGYDAAASAVDVSNEVTIGNSSISNVRIPADSTLKIGASGDLQLEHLSSNSFIKNTAVGDLYIENQVDDKDVIFRSDDGSGGLATYFKLDGATSKTIFEKPSRYKDDVVLSFGDNEDLQIQHNSGASLNQIDNLNGDLYIQQNAADKDIIFRSDDGSGGLATYLTIDGSDVITLFSKDTRHIDNVKANFGNANDLKISHDATDSIISNNTGDLLIQNNADDKDILFKSDNGSGGLATYFYLDGGGALTRFSKRLRMDDGINLQVGSSGDMSIYHNGTDTFIDNATGHLNIRNQTDDGDIIFTADDGSGGNAEYFKLDGGLGYSVVSKTLNFIDNNPASFGGGGDLAIKHDGTDSTIINNTGDLYIRSLADDKDIIFQSDDGSGGFATYFFLDGSQANTNFQKDIIFADNKKALFGGSGDLQIFHGGTNSAITNTTGNLVIKNETDDGDIIFESDDGSGGIAEYFRVDGGSTNVVFSKDLLVNTTGGYFEVDVSDNSTKHADNTKAKFGTGNDLEIYHDTSNSYISHVGTGQLIIENTTNDADVLFKSDDGSGGTTTYLRLDGSTKKIDIPDSIPLAFGASDDLQIQHDGSNSYISNNTGALYIQQYADDSDIVFQSDDGSSGVTEYFRVDGGSEKVIFSKTLNVVNSSANGKAATFDDGTSALHVVPSLGSGGYTGLSAAGDIGLIFTIDNDNTTDSTSNGLLIAPHTQTSGGLKILENGSVGIGISSPGSKLDVSGGDIETSTASKGLILKSPNGTRYRVTVDNSGNLSTAAL